MPFILDGGDVHSSDVSNRSFSDTPMNSSNTLGYAAKSPVPALTLGKVTAGSK